MKLSKSIGTVLLGLQPFEFFRKEVHSAWLKFTFLGALPSHGKS